MVVELVDPLRVCVTVTALELVTTGAFVNLSHGES